MTIQTRRTWVSDETVTADMMNQQIKDNLNELLQYNQKGDLTVAEANDNLGIVSVGSDGQVLTADSSELTGIKWSTPIPSGMVLIAEHEVTADTEFLIEFNNIPATYRHLKIIGQFRTVSGSQTTGAFASYIRFNDDTANNYDLLQMMIYQGTNTISQPNPTTSSYGYIGLAPSEKASSPYSSNYAFNVDANINNYRGSFYKNLTSIYHSYYGSSNDLGYFTSKSTIWKSVNPITKISISSYLGFITGYAYFKTGSYYSLYGYR